MRGTTARFATGEVRPHLTIDTRRIFARILRSLWRPGEWCWLFAILIAVDVAAQDPALAYQGRLLRSDKPANGTFEMQFRLWNSDGIEGVGSPVSPELMRTVTVSNGLFTTQLDFGSSPFTGALIWMEVGVRTNGAGTFMPLAPRQAVTATPYAVRAAFFDGPVSDAQLPSTVARAGQPWISTNVVSLSNSSNDFAGTFGGVGAFATLSVGSNGVPLRQLLHGTALVGTSTGGVKTVTVDLPGSLASTRLVATPRSENASEMFAVTARTISSTRIELNVLRIDAPGSGWTQSLVVDWLAWE